MSSHQLPTGSAPTAGPSGTAEYGTAPWTSAIVVSAATGGDGAATGSDGGAGASA